MVTAKTRLSFEGTEYEGDRLTQDEENLLSRHVREYIVGQNAWLGTLIESNWAAIQHAAYVAKAELDRPFRGLYAGDNEMGVQLIRPGHLLRTTATTETPQNDWTFTLTADADYWIGYSTNNQTAINIDKRIGALIWLGVDFSQGASPTVEELLPQVDGVNYPVQVIRHSWRADNDFGIRGCRIRPIIVKAGGNLMVQTYSIAQQQMEMLAVGLTFATGALMRLQAPSAVQT